MRSKVIGPAFIAACALLLVAACNESASPDAGALVVSPSDTTIEFSGGLVFNVTDAGGAPVAPGAVSYSSSDPKIVEYPCDPPNSFTVCAEGAGTATVTLRAPGGQVGTSRITVLPRRFVLLPDTPFVVGHESWLYAFYTDQTKNAVAYRLPDATIVAMTGTQFSMVRLEFLKAGRFDIEAINAVDTTIRAMFTYTIEAPRPARLVLLQPPPVTTGRNRLTLRVALRDQHDGPIKQPLPTGQVLGADEAVRIVSITPGAGDTTANVVIEPVRGGAATVRLAVGSVSLDIPITQRAVGPDSVAVTKLGVTLDLAANDAELSGPPRIVEGPAHGTATLAGSTLRYQPAAGFLGLDTVRYTATSGSRTDTASVRFNVVTGPFTMAALGPADSVFFRSMNDEGQVAGTLILTGGLRRAFRWSAGRFDTLSFEGRPTYGLGISNNGDVLGFAEETPQTARVLLWSPGQSAPRDVLGRTVSRCCAGVGDMSRNGTIAIDLDFQTHVVIRGDRVDTTLKITSNGLVGVNDRGTVAINTASLYPPPVLLFPDRSGATISLGGRGYGLAESLNNFDMAVGTSEYRPGGGTHAFLYDKEGRSGLASGTIDLTTFYGLWITGPTSVNDAGDILSKVALPSGVQMALLTHRVAVPLASLLVESSLSIELAYQLNAKNQFLATVVGRDGRRQAALFTPVP